MSYETTEQTDARLYRKILNGSKYESLIPKVFCKRIDGGKGNTEYSVNQMNEVVRLFSKQTTNTAQTLKKSSLAQTVQAIQDFLYWHFQYKRDLKDQLLRSPACSFAQRFDGIDCKSYSIFGASLLHELGYKSYFRRVSYQEKEPYGHVYVIVPKNQITADLSDGYYTIDGTLNINVGFEPPFYKNSDLPVMDKLNHHILNAPRGLGNSDSSEKNSWLKNIDFSKLFGWLKNIVNTKSAFNEGHLKHNFPTIVAMLEDDVKKVNSLLASGNYTEFSRSVREIYIKYLFMECLFREYREDGWNSTSKGGFDAQINFLVNQIGTALKALNVWVDDNFTKSGTDNFTVSISRGSRGNNNKDYFFGPLLYFLDAGPDMWIDETGASKKGSNVWYRGVTNRYANHSKALFSPKPNKTIPYFEMTVDLSNAITSFGPVDFNPQNFLNNLQSTATIFQGATSNNTGGYNPNTGGYNPNNPNPGSNTTGGNTTAKVVGGVAIASAIILMAPQFAKDNPKNKTNEK